MADTNKTNVGIRLFKGAYGADAATKSQAQGSIVFDETTLQIYVDGKVYGSASDVTYDNTTKMLTITKTNADGTKDTKTLDFSDTASASATLNVFKRLNDVIGENVTSGGNTLNYEDTNYLTKETTLVGADCALDAEIKAINDEIDAMDVPETTVQGNKPADGDATGNIKLTYSESDGVVEISKIEESYATVTANGYTKEGETKSSNFTVVDGDGEKLVKAKDLSSLKTYTDGQIAELRDDVNSQVEDLDADFTGNKAVTGTNVTVGVKEEDGIITTVTVAEKYATTDVSKEENGVTTFTTTNGTQLATGADVQNAADFTNTRIDEEIAKLDTAADVQTVTLTAATETTGAKLVFNGVKEEDGVIAAGALTDELQFAKVATSGAASDVTTTGIGAHTTDEGTTYDIEAGNVQSVLETLNTKINNLDTDSTLHLKKTTAEGEVDAETVSADGTEYKLYQGTDVVAKFNIEKDSFVREGEVVRGSIGGDGKFTPSDTGEYFIHLTIKTTDDTKETDLYIPAESLVDAYTANNTDKNVTVTVDNTNNTISASISVENEAAQLAFGNTDGIKIASVAGTDITVKTATLENVSASTVGGVQLTETDSHELQARVIDNSITTAKIVDKNVTEAKLDDATQAKIDGTIHDVIGENDTELNNTTYINVKATKAAVAAEGTATDNQKVTLSTSVQTADALFVAAHEEGEGDEKTSVAADLKINDGEGKNATGLLTEASISQIKQYVEAGFDALDADVTSDDDAAVSVEVKQVDGKITDVVVANQSAGVSLTNATQKTETQVYVVPNLTATKDNGVLLGSDVASFKSYVDQKYAQGDNTITNSLGDNDAINIVETQNANGSRNYDIKLVWTEWNTTTNA